MILHTEICPSREKIASMRLLAKHISRYYGFQIKVRHSHVWVMYAVADSKDGVFSRWEQDLIERYTRELPVMVEWFHRGMRVEQTLELQRKWKADEKPQRSKK